MSPSRRSHRETLIKNFEEKIEEATIEEATHLHYNGGRSKGRIEIMNAMISEEVDTTVQKIDMLVQFLSVLAQEEKC